VVVDKDEQVKGIVSLSDILTFLVLKPMGMYRYSPHDEHRSSGPRPVNFTVFFLELFKNNFKDFI
jgi:hypothetical protein